MLQILQGQGLEGLSLPSGHTIATCLGIALGIVSQTSHIPTRAGHSACVTPCLCYPRASSPSSHEPLNATHPRYLSKRKGPFRSHLTPFTSQNRRASSLLVYFDLPCLQYLHLHTPTPDANIISLNPSSSPSYPPPSLSRLESKKY